MAKGPIDPSEFVLRWYEYWIRTFMGNILYIIAVILVIAWAIGFIGYSAGGLIHVLLVIAIIAVLIRIISGNRAA